MSVAIDPRLTQALIIGVEEYEIGASWHLSGPALDAARFARWLSARGVPAGNITLLVSPLGDNQAVLDDCVRDLGIPAPRPATSSEIDGVFADGLLKKPGELLVVYWSGHGILDEDDRRLLFCANATQNSRRSISTDNLLRCLENRTLPGLHRQILIFDVCANFIEDMNLKVRTTQVTLPVGHRKHGVEQFVLYAAAQGQVAANNRTERYGEFSQALMQNLAQAPADEWPPDFESAYSQLERRFEALREQGVTRQKPVYLWKRGISGDVYPFEGRPVPDRARRAAAGLGLSPSQVRRLVGALRNFPGMETPAGRDQLLTRFPQALSDSVTRVEAPAEDLLNIVTATLREQVFDRLLAALDDLAVDDDAHLQRATIREIWLQQQRVAPLLEHFLGLGTSTMLAAYYDSVPDRQTACLPADLEQALELCAGMAERGDGVAPLELFVIRLEYASGTQIAPEWFSMTADRVNTLRSRIAAQAQLPASLHLCIDLCRPGAQPGEVAWVDLVAGYLRQPDGSWTTRQVPCPEEREDVHQAVAQVLDWARQGAGNHPLSIGFILPRALFCEAPEHWRFGTPLTEPVPLDQDYPVVLHSGERMLTPQIGHDWRTKFTELQSYLDSGQPADVLWVNRQLADDLNAFYQTIRSNADKPFVGFSFVPPAEIRPDTLRRDPIIAAIARGTPFMVWVDEDPGDWKQLQAHIRHVIQAGAFDNIPERLRALRAASPPAALGNAVRILWDDPNLVPDRQSRLGLATDGGNP